MREEEACLFSPTRALGLVLRNRWRRRRWLRR